MRTRRQFLFGHALPARGVARVAGTCLGREGIVCQACRDACGPGAVSFLPIARGASAPVVDERRCTGCGECLAVCPARAITLQGAPA